MPLKLPFRHARPGVPARPLDALPRLRGDALQQAARQEPARVPHAAATTSGCARRADRAAARPRLVRRAATPASSSVDMLGLRRPEAVSRAPGGGAAQRPASATRPCGASATIGPARRRDVRHGLRLHGRLDGHGRGREGDPRRGGARWPIGSRSIVVSASGGARMQEGTLSLMQLAKTVRRHRPPGRRGRALHQRHDRSHDRRRLRLVRRARRRQRGRAQGAHRLRRLARVSAGTIAESLPQGFQRSEFLFDHGFVDLVVPRHQLRDELGRCSATCARHPFPPTGPPRRRPGTAPSRGRSSRAWRGSPAVADAASSQTAPALGRAGARTPSGSASAWRATSSRPHTLELLQAMATDVIELHGDRSSATTRRSWPASPASTGGRSCSWASRRAARPRRTSGATSGVPTPRATARRCASSAWRRSCSLPVVTFVDTAGAHPGAGVRGARRRRGHRPLDHDHDWACARRSWWPSSARAAPAARWRVAVGDVVLALENADLLRDQPRGLRQHPVAQQRRRAAGRRGDAPDRARAGSRWASSTASCPSRPAAPRRTRHATATQLRAAIITELDRARGARHARRCSRRATSATGAWAPSPCTRPPTEGAVERPGLTDRLRNILDLGRHTLAGIDPSDGPPDPAAARRATAAGGAVDG